MQQQRNKALDSGDGDELPVVEADEAAGGDDAGRRRGAPWDGGGKVVLREPCESLPWPSFEKGFRAQPQTPSGKAPHK